jgi:hypothetical protein
MADDTAASHDAVKMCVPENLADAEDGWSSS